jgi:putative oxidoreductase
MQALNRFGPITGRTLIALIFLMSGAAKVAGFAGTVGYIASKGLPLPAVGAVAAIIVELGGGILLVIGWQARIAAAAMFVFTFLAAIFFHDFWAVPADQVQNTMIHFMKNISMMGGLLYVVIHGSGAFSLDARKRS